MANENAHKQVFKPTRWTLWGIILSCMLMLMGGAAVAPALPLINEAFPDQTFAVSLIITLPSLAVALTSMAIGTLADRCGKVKVLLCSLVIFTLGGVSSYFLDNLYLILVMRFIVGIGIAGISSTVTALITEYYTGVERTKVLGYQGAAMGLGVLVLELAGGTLAEFGWHIPFLVYLIGVPILILCICSMREPGTVVGDCKSKEEKKAEKETVKAARKAEKEAAKAAKNAGAEAAGGKRKANMALIVVIYVAIFLCQLMSFLMPTQMPEFLENDENGLSTMIVGLYLGANGVMNAIASLSYKRFVMRIRSFAVMGIGFLLMGFGMVLIMLFPSIYTAFFTMIFVGSGVGLICPATTNTLAGEVTSSSSGRIMGGYTMCLNIGQFAISLLSIPLLEMVSDSIPDLMGMLGVLALIVAVVFAAYCAKKGGFRPKGNAA